MDRDRLYFKIAKRFYSPITARNTWALHQYGTLGINTILEIEKYTYHYHYKYGYLQVCYRDCNKRNELYSIALALLEEQEYTDYNILLKDVYKYYNQRDTYLKFFEDNLTDKFKEKKSRFTQDELKREMMERGFRTSLTDKRWQEHEWHYELTLENGMVAHFPISLPDKKELKKLLYKKIHIKGITQIKKYHGS